MVVSPPTPPEHPHLGARARDVVASSRGMAKPLKHCVSSPLPSLSAPPQFPVQSRQCSAIGDTWECKKALPLGLKMDKHSKARKGRMGAAPNRIQSKLSSLSGIYNPL